MASRPGLPKRLPRGQATQLGRHAVWPQTQCRRSSKVFLGEYELENKGSLMVWMVPHPLR